VFSLGNFRARSGGRTRGATRSRWKAAPPLIAALALFLQTLFIPLHTGTTLGAKASALAELSAALGADVSLCAMSGDAGLARSLPDGNRYCSDGCPLCQFAGQADLVVPDAPSLPSATLTAPAEIGGAIAVDAPRLLYVVSAQPRAPPFAG
jgi:hypothetical protein